MGDARELEGIFETVEYAGAIVHAAGEGAGFDARVTCRRARRKITAHTRSEDAHAAGVDGGDFFEIIDHRRSRVLELDDQPALKPALALPRPVEGESRHAAAQKTVFHCPRFFF